MVVWVRRNSTCSSRSQAGVRSAVGCRRSEKLQRIKKPSYRFLASAHIHADHQRNKRVCFSTFFTSSICSALSASTKLTRSATTEQQALLFALSLLHSQHPCFQHLLSLQLLWCCLQLFQGQMRQLPAHSP